MDNKFNLNRFGKYFAYDLKSIWREQRVFLLVWCLLPIFFYMVYMFFSAFGHGFFSILNGISINRPPLAIRVSVFSLASVIFLVLFPSRTYGFVTEKAKGSAWLMLPASRLEKFLSMILICLVVAPIVYFCVYLLSDALVCLLDKQCGSSILAAWNDFFTYRLTDNQVWLGGNGLWTLVSSCLQITSVFLLGALIFKKMKVTKTVLALFVVSMVLFAIFTTYVSHADLSSFGERIANWMSGHADNIDVWINFWGNLELAIIVIGCGVWSWFRVKNLQH